MKYFFLIFFLLSCQNQDKEDFKNEINLSLASDVSTLDPSVAFDEISLKVINQVYETLFEYQYPSSGKDPRLKPLLAKEMPQVSSDKLKYTFSIKKNIHYHPRDTLKKRTVQSQDFINAIKRMAFLPTKSKGFWLFDGKIQGINEFRSKAKTLDDFFKYDISGIKKIDDYHFSIKLNSAFPQILFAFAMAFTAPIPSEAIKNHNNDFSEKMVATGPFILKEFKRGFDINLIAFENYHQATLPKSEAVNFKIIKESQTAWLNFLKGKIDFFGLGQTHFNTVLNKERKLKDKFTEKYQLVNFPTTTFWWLSFNMEHPILGKNQNLRKAISHAIDWAKYIDSFTNNTAMKLNSIYHPSVFGHKDSTNSPSYDPQLAKLFLAKAGFKNGRGLPAFNFDTRTSDSETLKRAEFIKSQLKRIGINIKVTPNSFPTFLQKISKKTLEIWQDGWSLDYPDSENILQLLHSKNSPPGSNATYYNNQEVNSLIDQSAVMEKGPALEEKLHQIQEKVLNDAPWIMQFYTQSFIIFDKKIKGHNPSPFTSNFLKYISKEN
jgi:ABC-type transport system substrate-binding protein